MCHPTKVERPKSVLAEGKHAGHEWLVVENGMGYRCGYVKVEAGHPWHGQNYDDVSADVHGGLTFGEADVPCDKGGPDTGFWFGFDCAHAGDAPDPELPRTRSRNHFAFQFADCGAVRTQEYVEDECRSLCEQASKAANGR